MNFLMVVLMCGGRLVFMWLFKRYIILLLIIMFSVVLMFRLMGLRLLVVRFINIK